MSSLIPVNDLPRGYRQGSNGEEIHREIQPGDLVAMLAEGWGDKLKYNLMTLQPELNGEEIDPNQIELFYILLSKQGWKVDKNKAVDSFMFAARLNSYHPIKEYLDRIENDTSIECYPIERFAQDYFGCKDRLSNEIMKVWFIGLIKRVFEPGCKFDTILTLRGPQGSGKSTFFKTIAGENNFNDTQQSKDLDLLTILNSCWIYEFAELETTISAKSNGTFKSLTSSSVDFFRKPYDRTPSKHKRTGVIGATVNEGVFIRDETGSRRIMTIDLDLQPGEMIDLEKIKNDRDKILKGAIYQYLLGDKSYLDKEFEQLSQNRNLGFKEESIFFEPIQRWLRHGAKSFFTTQEALIGSELRTRENMKQPDNREAAKVLKQLGCVQDKNQTIINGHRHRYWRKPGANKSISDNSDKSEPSEAPQNIAKAVISGNSSQISEEKDKKTTPHNRLPKAVRCELGKSTESSESLADFFDGAVVSVSHQEIKTESI